MMKAASATAFYVLSALLALYWVTMFVSTHTGVSVPDLIDNFDKVMHFTAYAGLAFFLSGLIFFRWGVSSRVGVWVWVTTFIYGGVDEFTQQFVPDRSPDVMDLVADLLGSAVGIACAYAGVRLWRLLCSRVAAWRFSTATSPQCGT